MILKYLKILFCLTITVMFYGCSEDEYNECIKEPVSFNSEIISGEQTRVVEDTSKTNSGNLIVLSAASAKGYGLSTSGTTRTSTVDGSWPSGGGYIAVQEGGTTKQYTLSSSGNITSSSPFYWESKANISITSWYPYSSSMPATWTVNSDQSTETSYGSSDLLYASNTFTYGGTNNLQYNHETAKVVINILKANDVTSASNISSVTVGTSGTPIDLSGTVGSTGAITATTTTTGYIKPYQTTSSTYAATYSALLIPQDMNGKQFIAIKVVGGNTFYYMPSTSTSLSGGYVYTYNVTVPSSTTNVGDYYFSDGSWGTLAVHCTTAVWPIGVIFSNSPSTTDQGYGWKHGYAMALKNIGANCSWAGSSYQSTDEAGATFGSFTYSDYSSGDYTAFIKDKDGYSETHAISSKYSSTLQTAHPAFWYALNYGTSNVSGTTIYASPTGSSGWFLPSIGQWWDIDTNLGLLSTIPVRDPTGSCDWYTGSGGTCLSTLLTNTNKYFTAINTYNTSISPDPLDVVSSTLWYHSSSEYNSSTEYRANFDNSPNVSLDNWLAKNSSTDAYVVRCCIAF